MGQYQTEHVDLQGCTLELLQRNTQSSVPFYISSKGYGFLWHNPAVGQVTFGANEIRWEAESALQADYLIVCGDTPAEISARYGEAVGTAPEMPEHGLGFWQCKLRYWNQEQLLSVAREYRRRGLPLDCIVCDFFHWTALGDFRFDPEFFPDPAAMVRELNEMGVRLVVSVWPTIGPSSENYREMARRNLLVRTESADQVCMTFGGENSMFYDVTNPEARDFVWDKIRRNYVDNGIRDFWLDVAEPEYSTYELRHFRYRMGPALQVGNLYPQLYAKNFYDGLRSAGVEKPVSLIRCAWAGSARYGALAWSGDVGSTWQSFRIQLCAGLSMGAAGIPWWNSDIGGFSGGRVDDPAFTELLIRWFEWGAYCPVMRLHGNREPGSAVTRADGKTCMMTGADNEVWSYGDEAYEIFKKYILRREALRPYIRTLMHAAHTDGTPVMRAMWYAFPQDPACAQLKDQYMFGDRYLVCPVMTPGARSREAYLPAGRWRCADTGAEYDGGQTVTLPAPLDCIPVLERV